jgi:predicted aldo/keto reductase-like oxidoreductase
MNYLDWEDEKVQSRKCYELALAHDKQILVMEPVKGGALATVSPAVESLFKDYNPKASVASWAVRFVASLKNVVMVLSGMSDEAQMEDNLSYMKEFEPLNDEELSIVTKAAEMIRADIAIPCTACRYCVDDCPMQISIPEYFRIYNRLKQLQSTQLNDRRHEYARYAEGHGKASECIECGMCEGHCPQNIEIRKMLKDVASCLE